MDVTTDDNFLFAAEGVPSELDVLLLADELGPGATKGGHADLTLPFRTPSRISIGEPVVAPLEPGLGGHDAGDIALQREQYEFYRAQFACSFAAAPGCRFTDARFEVALSGGAIAYDLFPILLEDPRTVTVTSSAKSELSFTFEPVSATLSLPSREQVTQEVRYASRIAAFDLRGTRPAWEFTRTGQHEIVGPQRLYMLIRKPRGSTVNAVFTLAARVQFVVGGRGFSPVDLVMVFRGRDSAGTLVDRPAVALC